VNTASALPRLDTDPGRPSARALALLRRLLERRLSARLRELLRAMAILFAYNRIGAVFTVAIGILAARWMGPLEYGKVGLVVQLASIASLLLLAGAHASMYRFLPSADGPERSVLQGSALAGAGLVTLALGALYLALRARMDGLLHIPLLAWDLAAALSFSSGATTLVESFLRGRRRFTLIARLRFASAMAFFATVMLLFAGVRRMSVGLYFGGLLGAQLLFSFLALTAGGLGPLRASRAGLRQVFGFGLLNTSSALLLVLFGSSDLLIVNSLLPAGDLGVYNIYQASIRGQFSALFFEVFCVVFIPTIATMDKLDVHRRFQKAIPLLFAGVSLAAAGLLVVGVWLAGPRYPLDLRYVALAAAGVATTAVFQISSAILSMEGVRGARLCLLPIAAALPFSAGLQLWFTRRLGLTGAMLGVVAGNLVLVAFLELTIRLSRRWLGAPRPLAVAAPASEGAAP
jgi:O-antigen/teichoic acid export membrane protein